MSSIGDRVKRLREKAGWSQMELSKRAGINNSVLSRIESGKRPVEDDLIIKFSNIFDVTADYILCRSDHYQLTQKEEIQMESEVNDWMKTLESLPDEERKEIEKMVSDYADYLIKKKQTEK